MNPAEVYISRHAILRFMSRSYHTPGGDPEAEIRRLLTAATPEDIGSVGRTLRLINNGFIPARYYHAEGWRFVLSEDGTRLLTCERRIYKGAGQSRRKRRKN